MIRFSVIMPSFLGKYKRSAKDRDKKIVRAVKSVLQQSFQNFQLIIVADGCVQTEKIIKANFYGKTNKIKMIRIKKQRMWSGTVRNAGIQQATGEYIVYLDIDDVFLKDHLKIIDRGITANQGYDWFYFNDFSYNKKEKRFDEHKIDVDVKGRCGTSNICHLRSLKCYWSPDGTYLHDYVFINNLKAKSTNYRRIETPQYGICHVPQLLDV